MDLSFNSLPDCASLSCCTKLIRLNLSKNKIKSLGALCKEEDFPVLKWLDVSHNKLGEFPAFKLPKLEFLDISGNKIEKINENWAGHENIRIVKCVDNKFKSLAPFKSMPKLEELYMAKNILNTLSGWENLPVLRKLHLRGNKIEKLPEEEMPELPALVYLNLRKNQIRSLDTIEKLFQFKTLTDINVINNPIYLEVTDELLMAQVLNKNPALTRFNKQQVTEKHLLAALHYGRYKFEKDEAERKRLEAIERAKQEAEQ